MLFKKFRLENNRKEIVTKSAIYFTLRICAFLFSYIFAIITIRKYGESTYGFITLGFSILMICSVITRLGLDINLTKKVAQNFEKENYGLYTRSILFTFFTSALISLIIYYNATFISEKIFDKVAFIPYLKWIAISIPFWSLIIINSGVFRGLKKNLLYSVFNSFGRFCFTIIILLFIVLLNQGDERAPIISHTMGLVLLCLLSFIYIFKHLGKLNFNNINPFRVFLKSSVPIFLSTTIVILLTWTDKLILGYYVNEEYIGIYDLSLRVAALIGFTLEALNSILTPKISKAFYDNDLEKMQNEIRFSAKINFYFSILVFLFILFFSDYILLFFSEKFLIGKSVLLICALGQLANSFSGPVGNILQMTGYQKEFSKIMFIAFIINVILNIILIDKFGINGAAVAMALSMIFWNFTSSYFIYKKLGIKSYYLPFN